MTSPTKDCLHRDELITNCLPYVQTVARRFSYLYHFDEDELFSVGSCTLVEKCNLALATDHPRNYLRCCAKWAMIDCMKHDRATPILSLDRPLFRDDPDSVTLADTIADSSFDLSHTGHDYSTLDQAIEDLRPGPREVILRRYGVLGHDPQNLRDIARQLYGGASQIGTATHRHTWAITKLSKHLTRACSTRPVEGGIA